jgi:heme exporter protein B
MFFFAVLTLLLFQFALDAGQDPRYRITPRVVERVAALSVPQPTAAPQQSASQQPAALSVPQPPAAPEAPATEGVSRTREALAPLLNRAFASQDALLDALAPLPPSALGTGQRVALVALARQGAVEEAAPGLIWVAFILAGVLGLAKSFAQEREQGSLEGLLLTPVPRGTIYLGKMLGNALFLAVILALLVPLAGVLLGVDLRGTAGPLALALLGGVLGFSALGTLLGGVTAQVAGREVLLPLLLFPLLVPLLLVEVHLTQAILAGEPLADQASWLRLLGAFDGIFLVVSYLVFDAVMES